jgi:phage FluMu protein gp41
MTETPTRIEDLYQLVVPDGLPMQVDGQTIYYRTLRLRETTVGDERKAEAMSERAMLVNGGYKLLVSESNFKHALNMLHIESFACDGQTIGLGLITLELYDKLSARDLELVEQRIFLLTLAAEVRYGNMALAEFEGIMAGMATQKAAPPPQPVGQTAAVGEPTGLAESGPAMLADYAGDAAHGQTGGAGQTGV